MVAGLLAAEGTDFEVLGTQLQQIVVGAQVVDTVDNEVGVVEGLARVDVVAGGIGLIALAVEGVADDVAVGDENLARVFAVVAVVEFLNSVEFNRQDALERRLEGPFHKDGHRHVTEGILLQVGFHHTHAQGYDGRRRHNLRALRRGH